MKNNWKKVALGGAALLSLITLAACGSSSNSASASKGTSAQIKDADKSPKLSFWWWGNDDRNQATMKQIKNFEAENSGISVEGRPSGFGNLDQVFTTQYAGGTSADVMTLMYQWVPQYGQNGGFYDLNKLSKYLDLKDNYDKAFLKTGQVGGKQVAVPYGENVMVMWVNKTVFEKNGVDVTKLKTWDDYINAAKKFPKGSYPLCSPTWRFPVTIYLQQKLNKTEFNAKGQMNYTEKDYLDGMKWYMSLVKDGVFVPRSDYLANVGSDPVSLATNKQEFTGKYAGGIGWNQGLQSDYDALKGVGDQMEIVPYPVISDAKGGANILSKPSMAFAIKKDEKNPVATAKFLNDFLNGEKANQILGTTRGVPASKSAQKALEKSGALAGFAKDANDAGKVDTMSETPFYEDGTLTSIYTDQIEAVELGKTSVKEAAHEVYTQTKAQAAKLAQQMGLK
ncbi:ABC transporter substrate-binding protein [Lactococcus kimchii]|uniref:ABC transporter substrate-binding protein n=1 Tax=Lactococcus sp. S-13 TaxID=2507158 RepID=UPI001023BE4F|nr:carbohydrate ABC transporter substrate-binding protein [Lactococcus sp. S-13]RZI48342.1 carbohydrate ABC transporter substrate-binding protein [Lactococcus sp. S-13]